MIILGIRRKLNFYIGGALIHRCNPVSGSIPRARIPIGVLNFEERLRQPLETFGRLVGWLVDGYDFSTEHIRPNNLPHQSKVP